jgi:hypothetical protein
MNILKGYEFKDWIMGRDAMQKVGSYLYPSTLNVEVISASEMLVTSYHTTWASYPKRQ